MKVLEKFKSKKNDVFLVKFNNNKSILKKFNNEENYFAEKKYYSILKEDNIKIPKVLEADDLCFTLLLENIEGKTVLEGMEKYEFLNNYDKAYELIKDVFHWIYNFHSIEYIKSNCLSLWDINFRNFIVKNDNTIYGIDFESINKGSLLNDTAKLIGMYLNYDEKYSDFKNRIVNDFKSFLIDQQFFSKNKIDQTIEFEICEIEKRRNNND